MIVVDANFLIILASSKNDNETLKVKAFVDHIKQSNPKATGKAARIGIPAPAFAELLMGQKEDEREYYSRYCNKQDGFKILDFDAKASVQLAKIHDNIPKQNAIQHKPWQKVKFDWQIIAIALAHNASSLVSNDDFVIATLDKMPNCTCKAIKIADIPLQTQPVLDL